MKIIAIIICLIFNVTNFAVASDGTDQKLIRLATEEYAPFTSTNLKHFGILSHIVTESFMQENIKVKYSFFPGARSFKLAQLGRYVGTFPWAKRVGREVDFYYSDPIFNVNGESLFYDKDSGFEWDPEKSDFSYMKGLKVGAINSYDYGEKFQEAEANGTMFVYRVPDLKTLVTMLLKKRIDVFISKELVARYILQSNFEKDQVSHIVSRLQEIHPPTYDYILFSKKDPKAPELLKSFNKGLAKLRASGRYDELLEDFNNGNYVIRKDE